MEFLTKVLVVAGGGAIGAVARYLLNISPLAKLFANFPFPTFFVNVTGSFFIGFFLILLTDKVQVSDNFRMMVMVGFLGSFTTFSTFEMEVYGLVRDRLFATAATYLVLSVAVGFIGLVLGIALARQVR